MLEVECSSNMEELQLIILHPSWTAHYGQKKTTEIESVVPEHNIFFFFKECFSYQALDLEELCLTGQFGNVILLQEGAEVMGLGLLQHT